MQPCFWTISQGCRWCFKHSWLQAYFSESYFSEFSCLLTTCLTMKMSWNIDQGCVVWAQEHSESCISFLTSCLCTSYMGCQMWSRGYGCLFCFGECTFITHTTGQGQPGLICYLNCRQCATRDCMRSQCVVCGSQHPRVRHHTHNSAPPIGMCISIHLLLLRPLLI